MQSRSVNLQGLQSLVARLDAYQQAASGLDAVLAALGTAIRVVVVPSLVVQSIHPSTAV